MEEVLRSKFYGQATNLTPLTPMKNLVSRKDNGEILTLQASNQGYIVVFSIAYSESNNTNIETSGKYIEAYQNA